MPQKESAKSASPTPPADADTPDEALPPDPGEAARVRAERAETEAADPGSTEVGEMGREEEEEQEPEKTFVEFQLLDAEGNPVEGENVKVTLPDGSERDLTTDGDGVVRVDEIDPGQARAQLPDRYDDEWDFKEVTDAGGGQAGT